ncbi:TPA: tRNA pseudouridine(13) synthase TruD [archaeon]|uniref:tRNA pseudouridine(13) synthase TruD n=1 Tax=Candidatus Naiadarchaeum limnaeum TaxID=2756139 RepID=A0A832V0K9_9ARCH|nr:tRNA pseudouridine(13) synthase TruD [Candidatus Naiadarchaeales archaeon SRR2090153.bin1042]HIK00679.1 tRNA pseudouridine(13) synthase TruD [Candidatus Naiadarchaeum limnaeum]
MDLSKIGITEFATKTSGIGGIIKKNPGDFIVQEISLNGEIAALEPNPEPIENNSEYTEFTLVKNNWNQAILLKKISDRLGFSKKRLHFAGTKDKYAITAQRISAWKISPEQLSKVSIKDCKLGEFEGKDSRLELGDLWGNRFTILIREITAPKHKLISKIEDFLKELKKLGGLPNFFGEQRFGIRLNNHIIGKKLIQNDIEGAIKSFLAGTIENELAEGKEARIFLSENWGKFKDALKKYPVYMRFERALLNHLVQFPNDYVGAFKKLHKNTYKLFTHAFQADAFNQELSSKIKNDGSLSEGGTLVGYNTELNDFQEEFLKKEGLSKERLKINSFPEASISGGPRKFLAEIKNISYSLENNNLKISFDLEKGAYATVFLHELMKV